MSTRLERTAQIRQLQTHGFSRREIAASLGLSPQTISNYINDPDGSKQKHRRQRYRRRCIDCGQLAADGSGGYRRGSVRCAACAAAYMRSQQYWTRERLLDAVQRWAAQHGSPPCVRDWIHVDPVGGFPNAMNCYRDKRSTPHAPFRSWNEMIAAAGFTPRTSRYARTGERGLHAQSRKLLVWLREHPGEHTTLEITVACGGNRRTASRTLRMLVRRGLIEQIHRGRGRHNPSRWKAR